jgi:hypothetical protein
MRIGKIILRCFQHGTRNLVRIPHLGIDPFDPVTIYSENPNLSPLLFHRDRSRDQREAYMMCTRLVFESKQPLPHSPKHNLFVCPLHLRSPKQQMLILGSDNRGSVTQREISLLQMCKNKTRPVFSVSGEFPSNLGLFKTQPNLLPIHHLARSRNQHDSGVMCIF